MQPLTGPYVYGVNRRSENFLLLSDLLFAKTTLAASVTNTLLELCSDVIKGWKNLLQGVHAGDGPLYNTLVKAFQ